MGSRTVVDRPLAVVNAVNTASPVTWWVSVDHLNRPVKMTDAAKASVWTAVWAPWGSPHSITGTATLHARFPGQWYQMEAGLHYNWHRSYDPTLGRYTQPDPLGFVDGPSVYSYVRGTPLRYVDRDGRLTGVDDVVVITTAVVVTAVAMQCYANSVKQIKKWIGSDAGNFNCSPGKCCLTHESTDSRGRTTCNYECGADGRKMSWPKDTKHIPCIKETIDYFNPPGGGGRSQSSPGAAQGGR